MFGGFLISMRTVCELLDLGLEFLRPRFDVFLLAYMGQVQLGGAHADECRCVRIEPGCGVVGRVECQNSGYEDVYSDEVFVLLDLLGQAVVQLDFKLCFTLST